ncbi:hypothetical protein BLA23254_01476 [Burkholderia lata]|uniref:Uncharacterized protein n=1 Tax=Burkholderia lata (strain ATCC 17760 / DSM 23089 / LMG 22485 / NCIMB 9086 / R18194 / 383) TaxID=482957 RepID=A0A6P2ITK0_BURL3|nr:hypothetical protein BLA23254_01476 [Burkholderia lata]
MIPARRIDGPAMLPEASRDGYPRQVRCGRLLLHVTGAGADAPARVDREAWGPRSMGPA